MKKLYKSYYTCKKFEMSGHLIFKYSKKKKNISKMYVNLLLPVKFTELTYLCVIREYTLYLLHKHIIIILYYKGLFTHTLFSHY